MAARAANTTRKRPSNVVNANLRTPEPTTTKRRGIQFSAALGSPNQNKNKRQSTLKRNKVTGAPLSKSRVSSERIERNEALARTVANLAQSTNTSQNAVMKVLRMGQLSDAQRLHILEKVSKLYYKDLYKALDTAQGIKGLSDADRILVVKALFIEKFQETAAFSTFLHSIQQKISREDSVTLLRLFGVI